MFTCVSARRSSKPASPATSWVKNQSISVAACCLGQPRKERVALAGPGLLEVLEPIDKAVDVAWDVSDQAGDLCPHGLDIFALGALDLTIVLEVFAPRFGRKARFELPAVVFGKLDLKVFKARSSPICRRSLSTRDRWKPSSSSSFYGGETDGGDSIGIRVSGPVEFLAEDVGIDFLINEVAGIELQAGCKDSKRGSAPRTMGVPV